MNTIDVFDNGINVNGSNLIFPVSYNEIKDVLGDARLVRDDESHTSYYYDELGIEFDGSTDYLSNLRKKSLQG